MNSQHAEDFLALAQRFVYGSLALSPVDASQAGFHACTGPDGRVRELDAELDSFSPEAIEAQRRFYREWQGRFGATPAAAHAEGDENAADWQLLHDRVALSLLELDRVQSWRHNPTVYVELVGNALFLPLTQTYAPEAVRAAHAVARMEQIPRLIDEARRNLSDVDPVFLSTAVEENAGNVDLIRTRVGAAIPAGTPLRARYEAAAARAVPALEAFSRWMERDLAKQPHATSWRLGPELYAEKFRLVMETRAEDTPARVLADAERDLASTREAMLRLALPLHAKWFPAHGDHANLAGEARENAIVGEVLDRIADDHTRPGELIPTIQSQLDGIRRFIREHGIVSLSAHDNLKVVPTPKFLRGVYSVAGFHAPPPLEPDAEAQYWVTPIDPSTPPAKAESRLREYNNWVLQWLTIHEALPGHYIQFEHANGVEPPARRLVRTLFGNGPYIEGWAEYVSDVMTDEGFLGRDPRYLLSRGKIRLRVIANAILDIRMQTMNMTDKEAMDLMTKRAFQTEAEAQGKLLRAKLTSCQLPTYFVGQRDWWGLRRRYQSAAGARFELERFHDRALDEGPIPIKSLEPILMRELERSAARQAGPVENAGR